jgi:hypothetical protein
MLHTETPIELPRTIYSVLIIYLVPYSSLEPTILGLNSMLYT